MARSESENGTKKCTCCCFPKRDKSNAEDVQQKSEICQVKRQPSKVPFHGELPKNLTVGNVINVSGFIQSNCIRFSVNLTCGKGPTADIAFHFNPRLDRKYVVRNSRLGGHWGEEETASIVKYDLPRNKKFDIVVFIGKDEFMVSMNGKHFCSFRFRVPLDLLTDIEVHGNVDVYDVEYKILESYPESKPENQLTVPIGEDYNIESQQFLMVPCTGYLEKGFEVGWQLEIYGSVKLLPHSFYINLQDGPQLWPHPLVHLHLNPRFSAIASENVFVRNAWLDGRWGPEERAPGFQFSPGAPFSLAIRRAVDHFSVWVDGQLSGEFKFRSQIEKIDTVFVQGDVNVQKIVMHEKIIDLYKK